MGPAERDWSVCVGCGMRLEGEQASLHHRRHGDRADMRPSAQVVLHGSGITGCHGVAGGIAGKAAEPGRVREEMERRGITISRHTTRAATLYTPVWYNQPDLARVGWFLLDDLGGLEPLAASPDADARELALCFQGVALRLADYAEVSGG